MRPHSVSTHGLSPAERRWAAIERVAAWVLMLSGSALIALGVLAMLASWRGEQVHPDAVLLPLLAGLPVLGFGGLLHVAASAMRRAARNRWHIQAMTLAIPAVVALFLALSYM
jgi:hypothetical protein